MIHEIGVELQAYFSSVGCPLPIIDGPEFHKTNTGARERVVIEEDPDGDQFLPRHRAGVQPTARLTRVQGMQITIFTQDPHKGALYWEHKRRADHVLDVVLIGLYNIAKTRKNELTFSSGKFVHPDDLKESEKPAGAEYLLKFKFDRGIFTRKWDGSDQPTAAISAVAPDTGTGIIISNTNNVSGFTEDGGSSTEPA